MTDLVIDKITLIKKLNSMPHKEISELLMHHLFVTLGHSVNEEKTIQEEE